MRQGRWSAGVKALAAIATISVCAELAEQRLHRFEYAQAEFRAAFDDALARADTVHHRVRDGEWLSLYASCEGVPLDYRIRHEYYQRVAELQNELRVQGVPTQVLSPPRYLLRTNELIVLPRLKLTSETPPGCPGARTPGSPA